MLPGFHPIELIIVFLIALLIFGPKKLPEMGSAIGKTIKEFQKSIRDVKEPSTDAASATLPAARAPEAQQIAAPSATVASEASKQPTAGAVTVDQTQE